MKNRDLAYLFFILAFLIALHQALVYDVWFEMADLHHETWIVGSICLAVGVLMGENRK